jgi:hypothetical protein
MNLQEDCQEFLNFLFSVVDDVHKKVVEFTQSGDANPNSLFNIEINKIETNITVHFGDLCSLVLSCC